MPLLLPTLGDAETLYNTPSKDFGPTLNTLGITIAVLTIVPAAVFGWTQQQCATFLYPVVVGWFLFDFICIASLALRVNVLANRDEDDQ